MTLQTGNLGCIISARSTKSRGASLLSTFRFISVLEGISYLLILSVTFGVTSRDYVYPLGMLHGLLFVLYLVFSLIVANKRQWSLLTWLPVFLASLVPLAFIPVEVFLRKDIAKSNTGG